MTRVAFRVDGSVRIGTGHVMRCLTLADRLREVGAHCVFLHRRHSGHMAELIAARGFVVHLLATPPSDTSMAGAAAYEDWLGVSPERDADETTEAIGTAEHDWLIVDHYALGASWHRAMRARIRRIAVIDDLANRELDCDLLVDQNYFVDAASRYEDLVPAHAELLLGPQFALLAPEYAANHRRVARRRSPPSRLLVYYGGSDVTGQTARALRVLGRPEFSHLTVDVVVGLGAPDKDTLAEMAEARSGTTLHGPRRSLVDLMNEADLMLGAAGATSWERCALGLPSIVTSIAPNQEPIARQLSEVGAVDYVGPAESMTDETLVRALRDLIAPGSDRLGIMASVAGKITDGQGTARVADHLIPVRNAVALRPAGMGDARLLLAWRNEPGTLAQSLNPQPVSWEVHEAWLARMIAAEDCRVMIAEVGGESVGTVRAEKSGGTWRLSWSVAFSARGRGIGSEMVARFVDSLEGPIRAEVKVDNVASCRIAERVGMALYETIDGVHHFTDTRRPTPSGDPRVEGGDGARS